MKFTIFAKHPGTHTHTYIFLHIQTILGVVSGFDQQHSSHASNNTLLIKTNKQITMRDNKKCQNSYIHIFRRLTKEWMVKITSELTIKNAALKQTKRKTNQPKLSRH